MEENYSIYLNQSSFRSTANNFGMVAAQFDENDYTIQYLNKTMLLGDLQAKLNDIAEQIVGLPDEADRVALTSAWQTTKEIMTNISDII